MTSWEERDLQEEKKTSLGRNIFIGFRGRRLTGWEEGVFFAWEEGDIMDSRKENYSLGTRIFIS